MNERAALIVIFVIGFLISFGFFVAHLLRQEFWMAFGSIVMAGFCAENVVWVGKKMQK